MLDWAWGGGGGGGVCDMSCSEVAISLMLAFLTPTIMFYWCLCRKTDMYSSLVRKLGRSLALRVKVQAKAFQLMTVLQSHGDKRIGYAPAMENDPTLRHPDINLQPQYDVLQEDLRSEVS